MTALLAILLLGVLAVLVFRAIAAHSRKREVADFNPLIDYEDDDE